jgi:hypothetical protein
MAYTPTPNEARRLERAVDMARFSEWERIWWLVSFVLLAAAIVKLVSSHGPWEVALGALFALVVLYWRLRACFLAARVRGDRGLFGVNLATREQRAFTALMFRQVLTGRNGLAPRDEHDPAAEWARRLGPREAAPDESG